MMTDRMGSTIVPPTRAAREEGGKRLQPQTPPPRPGFIEQWAPEGCLATFTNSAR